jgi:hypothetical protein
MPKATKVIVEARVEQVAELLVTGRGVGDILRFASEKSPETGRPWRVSDRQVETYIARAHVLIARRLEPDREKRFRLALAQRNGLLVRALDAGDLRTALAILKDRDELEGLYPSSLTDMQDELLRLQRLVEEYRNGTRKTASGNGQAQGHRRDGHAGAEHTHPGRIPSDSAN